MKPRLINVLDSAALARRAPRRIVFALSLAFMIAFAACTQAPVDLPPAISDPQPPPPLTVSSSIIYEPSGDIHLSNLRFVSVGFNVIGAGANDLATVEFIAPSGSPYETRPATFVGTAFEEHRLDFPFAVGGTVVETSQLTGTWKALLLINGRLAASPTFDINP